MDTDAWVMASFWAPKEICTPVASSTTVAPDAAVISTAASPAVSRSPTPCPPGLTLPTTSGEAPLTPSPVGQTPPDQMGARVMSPAGHSTKTRASTGGTTAKPTPGPANTADGWHQPVVSSPVTSGTFARTRPTDSGSSLSTTT